MKANSLLLSLAALTGFGLQPLLAKVQTETVEYKDGDTVLEGYVAWDDAVTGPRPGVLVIHDWTGLQDYAKRRTTMLAELGYIAFAADIYGKGVRPTDPKECAIQAGTYKNDLPTLRRRVTLGYDQLLKRPGLDAQKTAAIGYCFGGTSVLELARSGSPVAGVVSFHGGLGTTLPAAEGAVKGKVLVCHGADDPFVKPPEQEAFREEMAKAKVSYDFLAYPGAVHSFTKPEAGNDPSKGQAYNEAADKKSWQDMKDFFAKIFGK
jgi:dienelactone hydrolase